MCTLAHRLLLWLHLLHLEQSKACEEAAERKEDCALHRGSPPAPSQGIDPPGMSSDAAVVARLAAALFQYEEKMQAENLTRVLLLEELLDTSSTVRKASVHARRRLRQQHGAVRRLSLSDELARAARRSSRCSRPPASIDAVRTLRDLEHFLGPRHFAWWRQTVEVKPTSCPQHVLNKSLNADTGAPSAEQPIYALRPLPLQATVGKSEEESCNDTCDDDDALDVLIDENDTPEQNAAAASEVEAEKEADAANAAYAKARRAADEASYAAARAATLAGCPLPENISHIDPAERNTSDRMDAGAALRTPDVDLENVNLVVQPVLGSGAAGQWHHSSADALTCVVCELDDVVVGGADEGGSAAGEDRLVACDTCGAPVHAYCACTSEVNEKKLLFCCNHCCAAQST